MTTFPPAPRRRFRSATAIRVGAVALLWVIMTGWLIRFEACPEKFTGRFEGYRDLFKSGILVRSSWMRILANGTPVGYSHTEIDVDERSPTEHYRIDSEMELVLNILNQRQDVYTRLFVTLDILSRLQRFTFSLNSSSYQTEISGKRLSGNQYTISIKAGAKTHRRTMTIPDDVILYSPMLEQALGALNPGESRVFKTLDPASMAVADIRVRADRRETLTLRGREEKTTALAADYQGMTIWTWVNAEGEILRQETPLGWVMEACDPSEAVAYKSAARGKGLQPDMLASAAAPADRSITEPRRIRKLEVLLKGVDISASELTTSRQTVLGTETNGIRLLIRAPDWPVAAETESATGFSNELAATPFIQSDDPALVEKARAITKGTADLGSAAQAINTWVFTHVRKNPAVSLPSAVAVLEHLEGDCNEHTYLTVGLARAAGIPAKVMAGIVYMNGAFYYHAWPSVHIGGQWVDMDPTFGQTTADATHIALAEGELAGQTRLLRYVGRLSVGILSAEKENSP
jgi:hypothetical protein